MPDVYAVMGHPVTHSKSPFIHARFAEQTGEALTYEAISVEPGGFAQAVAEFRAAGGRGLNVTLPYKEEASTLCAVRTERAQLAGAVNTIWFSDGDEPHGDNTDGAGLVRDLGRNLGLALRGADILLLGAGGAARGVVAPLLAQAPARLVIANRTPSRAEEVRVRFASLGPLAASTFEALRGDRFDLVLNATSASLVDTVPPVPRGIFKSGAWCYDLMYAREPTAFVRWGEANGAAGAVDGVGMLVEQAAESFVRWRGLRPLTQPVIAALRAAG